MRILSRVIVYNNNKNKILLVRNKNCSFWYVPGGGWEYEKESILDCGVREIKEETGVDVILDKFIYLREYHEKDKIFFEAFWLAHMKKDVLLNKNHIDMDPNGSVEEIKWFSKNELRDLIVFPELIKKRFWDELSDILNSNNRFISF